MTSCPSKDVKLTCMWTAQSFYDFAGLILPLVSGVLYPVVIISAVTVGGGKDHI